MAIDLRITTDKDKCCEYVTVTDITTTYIPLTRTDFGLALFWSTDAFATDSDGDFSSPGAVGTLGIWSVPTINNNIYTIVCFAIQKWITGVYANVAIIWYDVDGNFYQNQSGAPTAAVPGDVSGNWVLLTTSLADYNRINVSYTVGLNNARDETEQNIDCDSFVVAKTSCRNYTITNNSGVADVLLTLEIYAYNDTATILQSIVFLGGGTTVTLTTDGVYFILITEYNIFGSVRDTWWIPLYEFCGIQTCMLSLVKSILCNELDPCCDSCDEETLETIKNQRQEINKMILLWATLMGYIHVEKMRYLNVFQVDNIRSQYMIEVGDLLVKLSDIATRCGLCADTGSTATNNCDECV